ncbi:MAG TPA: PAS domain S-box protein [Mucilaginibacter sp.]|jgi:PAS domain S-box-containing protein
MDTRLSFLFDKSNDFFWVMDRNGTILHTNVALRKVLGYPKSEINGKKANEFLHPADTKRREELLNNIVVHKEISGYESRIRAKNGRYYNIKWSYILSEQDGLIYASGINSIHKLKGADRLNITKNIEHIIQSFSEGFFIIDHNWQIISFNPAFQAITGLTTRQLTNINFRQLTSLGIADEVMAELEIAFNSTVSSQVQYFNAYFKRWLRLNIYPYQNEITVLVTDITSIKIQELILALEKKVLELNASSLYSLPQTIKELLIGIEEIYPDMICSVLEVDEAQERVYHLSAPGLPTEYCNLIDGSAIGPRAGSCGTAAYHRIQVIVSNIETDPLWDDYRQFALPYGLKACWSTPIISSHSSKVLATFAAYYTTPREPKDDELQMIERTSNILRILMENKKNQDHVKNQNLILQEIASISSHEIRRPVATILGLVNLFDPDKLDNPLNKEIMNHLELTARELDGVIHTIVEKTIYLKSEGL